MKQRLFIERAAEADLLEIAAYIREERPASAPLFVTAAREAFARHGRDKFCLLIQEQEGYRRPRATVTSNDKPREGLV